MSATDSPPERRRRPAKRRPQGRIANAPVTIRYGLPLALVLGLVYWAWDGWVGPSAVLRIVSSDARATAGLRVELFAYEPERSSASPSAKIGAIDCPDGILSLGREVLGGTAALARITAPGMGMHWALLELGTEEEIELAEARSVSGHIIAAPALLAGARVQAFGGGTRGVLLLETETGADGSFTLSGLSSNLRYLLLRVFQDGFAVAELDWEVDGRTPLELTLQATKPLQGQIEFCRGLLAQPMELRAYEVPGVSSRSDAQGKFRMEHLPPEPIRTAILLSSLPPEFTHRRLQVLANEQPVKLETMRSATVRGQVVNGNDGEGVPGAKVLHEHGPNGYEIVECDQNGFFEIGRVPAGEVRLDADLMVQTRRNPLDPESPRQPKLIQGHTIIDLIEGETLENVVIKV